MADTHTEVTVSRIPDCDFCKEQGVKRTAYADAKTWTGRWANVCRVHFSLNSCFLGLGRGQAFRQG